MKQKPQSEKDLDGNPGKRKSRPKARPTGARPTEPRHLEPVGIGEWRRLTNALEQCGKLTLSDEGLILSAAISYQRVQEAEQIISDQGLIVEGDKGVEVKNPACQLSRDYTAQSHKAIQLLGLDASSRPDAPPADLYADPFGDLD